MHRTRGCTMDVGCDSVDITRVDRVDWSPPNHHQQHVQKCKPSIALSENRTLEMLSRDHAIVGRQVDSPRRGDGNQMAGLGEMVRSWSTIVVR